MGIHTASFVKWDQNSAKSKSLIFLLVFDFLTSSVSRWLSDRFFQNSNDPPSVEWTAHTLDWVHATICTPNPPAIRLVHPITDSVLLSSYHLFVDKLGRFLRGKAWQERGGKFSLMPTWLVISCTNNYQKLSPFKRHMHLCLVALRFYLRQRRWRELLQFLIIQLLCIIWNQDAIKSQHAPRLTPYCNFSP